MRSMSTLLTLRDFAYAPRMKTKLVKAKPALPSETDAQKLPVREADNRFHHGHLRKALLTRLLEVLDTEGMEGIGVRRLARDLDVDPAAIYRHFRDLEALNGAAAEACFSAFAGVMERAIQKGDAGHEDASGRATLIRAGEAYVRYASTHPHRCRLMFGAQGSGPDAPPRAEGKGPSGMTAWDLFLSVVKRSMPEAEATLDARMAWSMVHGVAALTLDGPFAQLGAAEQKRLHRFCGREVPVGVLGPRVRFGP